jgi:aspartyl protease family protein
MGTFRQQIEVGDFEGRRFTTIEALVDTGVSYTSIPRDVLEALRVEATENHRFVLANGQRVSYGMAWVRIRIDDREQPTPVIFGDIGSQVLLGAVTLEEFGLGVDPLNLRLVPVEGYLVGIREDA